MELKIINPSNFDVDSFESIDLSKNIIFFTPQNKYHNIINLDFTDIIKIKYEGELNLLGNEIYMDLRHQIIVNFTPYLKILCPKGIIPFFEPSRDFIINLSKKFDTYSIEDSDTILYQNFNFKLIFDLQRVRETYSIFQLNNLNIIDLIFVKSISFQNEIDKIYWYQNDQIFKNILKSI